MFIVDFDDTLFDTQRFKQARLAAVADLGVSEEIFWKSYYQARNASDGSFVYSDERHAQILSIFGFEENKILEKLKSVSAKISNFLFNDSIDFLEFLRSTKQRLILLSLGDPNFQEYKVKGVGIEKYFDHLFMISSDKKKIIEKIFKFEKADEVWFINDKPDETLEISANFKNIKPVLKVSPNRDLSDYTQSKLPCFYTLTEIKNYVAQFV
jgi:FMN phosphatase YigB (HAD superfamily)